MIGPTAERSPSTPCRIPWPTWFRTTRNSTPPAGSEGEALLAFVQRVVAESRALVSRNPQFTVVDLHGGNHFIFLQRPREVARAMRAFLSRHD